MRIDSSVSGCEMYAEDVYIYLSWGNIVVDIHRGLLFNHREDSVALSFIPPFV